MKEIRISAPGRTNIVLVNIVPSELDQYKLTGAISRMGKEDFGQLIFHHFQGNGYDIWYSNYRIRKPVILAANANDPLLEWHIPFVNGFNS